MQLRHIFLIVCIGALALSLWLKPFTESAGPHNSSAHTRKHKVSSHHLASRLTVRASNLNDGPVNFRKLLQDGDFCAVARVNVHEGDYVQQFLQSLDLESDTELRDFALAKSPFFRNPENERPVSRAARFFHALQLAGEISGQRGGHNRLHDKLTAWTLLTQLHAEDPTNGAYLFFRLGIEADQDYPLDQRQATMAELIHATQFNTFRTDLYREIYARMHQNPAKFLAGIRVLNLMLPEPIFGHSVQAIRDLDFHQPGLAMAVGQMMTNEGLRARDTYKTGGYDAAEYAVGRELLSTSGQNLPTREDLDREKSGPRGDFSDLTANEDGSPIEFLNANGTCDEQAVARFASRMSNW